MAIIDKPKPDAQSDPGLAWKYPSEVLRLGAQLNVGPNQEVLFVKAGRALDLFAPGKYTLSAVNLPLLDQTINLTADRKTQFTAELWYVDTQARRDLAWETAAPIAIVDPVYNFSVNVQCRGRWGGRIRETRTFITQMAAALKDSGPEKVVEQLTATVVKRFSELLSNYFVRGKTSVVDAHAKLNELSSFIAENLRPELSQRGWEMTLFQVDQLSIPDEAMKKFQELIAQKTERERLAAAAQPTPALPAFTPAPSPDPSSGETAFYALRPGAAASAPMTPPPAPPTAAAATADPVAKLKKLKQLLENGLITQQDFDTRKQKILDDL